jgi:hypothetical protein
MGFSTATQGMLALKRALKNSAASKSFTHRAEP